jgi:hypothetical protein
VHVSAMMMATVILPNLYTMLKKCDLYLKEWHVRILYYAKAFKFYPENGFGEFTCQLCLY